MAALEATSHVQAAFKFGIGNVVASVVIHFDVVHQAFAGIQQADLGVIDGGIIILAVVQHAGVLDVHPGRLLGFVAVRPVGGQTVIGMGIDQFQAAAAAGGPFAPASARAVSHFVLRHIDRVGASKAFAAWTSATSSPLCDSLPL